MSTLNDITELITGVSTSIGYPATGQTLPYVVTRGLFIGDEGVALDGSAVAWDNQFSVYCAAASAEASYNLGLMVMQQLQGKRVGGSTLSTSMGYIGAQVEGHYESQVTVQLNSGGIS